MKQLAHMRVTRVLRCHLGDIDLQEYAPVVKFTTLRIFFAIVANLDLHCHQMDVKTAFLNGDLDQDVFMELPEGCVNPDKPDFVCKLQKALYGLKQAPRQWYAKINSFLTESLHFQCSLYDPCLYVYNKDGEEGSDIALRGRSSLGLQRS